MRIRNENGFTLIELVIVIAIVGILSAIAFPAYTSFVQEGRRADAQNLLLQIASLQEQFFSENGSYAPVDVLLADVDVGDDAVTDGGHYEIGVVCTPQDDCTGLNAQTYLLTAEPQGIQDTDECGSFTYNQAGQRDIADADAGIEADDCW